MQVQRCKQRDSAVASFEAESVQKTWTITVCYYIHDVCINLTALLIATENTCFSYLSRFSVGYDPLSSAVKWISVLMAATHSLCILQISLIKVSNENI